MRAFSIAQRSGAVSMEQRISRSDLHWPQGTPAPELDTDAIARIKRLSDFHIVQHENIEVPAIGTVSTEPEDDDVAFQLFATNKQTTEGGNRIRLRSPTPATGDPGFANPRDLSFYLVRTQTSAENENLASSAVSGKDVLARSHAPWPGTACPWKILHLPSSGLTRSARMHSRALSARVVGTAAMDAATKKHRTRPNKKTRIKTRVQLAASRTAVEAREVAEREKRVRRNREKKVKKRAREKARKGGGVEGGGDDDGAADDGGRDESP